MLNEVTLIFAVPTDCCYRLKYVGFVVMPALRFLGRKWSTASDDFVFPGIFEISFRFIWLVLMVLVVVRYYPFTWGCTKGGEYVRVYLIGMVTLLSIIIILLIVLVNRSAKGAIMEMDKRKCVPPLLVLKLFLIIPETILNCLGTIWTFSVAVIECKNEDFSHTVIEALVIFDWVLFGLTLFGLAMIFDPMGSKKYQNQQSANVDETLKHNKNTNLWMRRFRWLFCWMRSDEYRHEAFQQVAGLLSALFRSTDLVPSDLVAGFVLLRIKQKKEIREKRRLQMLADDESKYSTDINRVFSVAPRWMNLKNARHFLRLSIAAYGWPFVIYRYPMTGLFRLLPSCICCSCFRTSTTIVKDDNCCLCNLAGVKYWSRIDQNDIYFVSFRNHIFELPFCVIADHKTSSIVIAIRGSISMRDIFTDLTAGNEQFEVEDMPVGTVAHKGMLRGAYFIEKRLKDHRILEKVFTLFPEYDLVLTGHSLGASVASLLGIILKPQYPDLKVYAFACPAATISRDAARITESFIFTIGVGDDFVMRLCVHSVENFRTALIQTLHSTRLPKYRIVWNGFGYALFGVPPADLETTWTDETDSPTVLGDSPLLGQHDPLQTVTAITEATVFSQDINVRRFSKTRLFNAGRILYIVHRKKTKAERKNGTGGPSFEMRWANAEDFTELKVMPRMLVDHFPENVYEILDTILKEMQDDVSLI